MIAFLKIIINSYGNLLQPKHKQVQLLLFFIFLFFNNSLFAQSFPCTYQLSGQVYNADNKEVLSSAYIFIEEIKKATLTDNHGHFQYANLCKGAYLLHVSFMGYMSQSLRIQLDTSIFIKIRLEEKSIILEATTIQAEKLLPMQTGMAISQIDEIGLDKLRGKSLGETLKTITGVTTLQTGNSISKPVIHGLHSNRVLIFNNGIRQEGQQWGSEHAPEIDPFIAQNIAVVKGAAGVRYGSDAIGGVVILAPRHLPLERGMKGEINTIGASNGLQGTISGILEGNIRKKIHTNGLSWRIQGTIKRSGNIRTPNYYLSNTGLREVNFSTALGYQRYHWGIDVFFSRFSTQLGIFTGAHIGNLTDLRRVIANGEPLIKSDFSYKIDRPFQDINHNLLKINNFIKFDNIGKITTTYAIQVNNRKEYDAHRPLNDSLRRLNRPELDFSLTTQTLDVVFEHKPLFSNLVGSVGLSGMRQANIYQGRPLIPNFRSYLGGIFWIERWVKTKYEVEWGLRYDYKWMKTFERLRSGAVQSTELIFNNFSGTIGSLFRLSKNLEWKTNIATAWRPPNINELFSNGVHHGSASYELGDESLTSETAYNVNTSFNYTANRLAFDVVLYYNYIKNFIYLKPQFPEVLTIRGAFPSFQYTQTDAIFRGIDAKTILKISPQLTLTTKGSFLWAYNQRADDFLVLIPANRIENEIAYTFKDNKIFKNRILAASLQNVFRQNRVPANSDYALPPAGYYLVNIDFNTDINLKNNKILGLGLHVNNLLNIAYRDYMNRFRYFSDEIGRNILLKIKFTF
jgi:iron complex outermembrane receptor protein